MTQQIPVPPGIPVYDIDTPAIKDPSSLSNPPSSPAIKLDWKEEVLVGKCGVLVSTLVAWPLDVVKQCVMGGKSTVAAVNLCYSRIGLFPSISSGVLFTTASISVRKYAEDNKLGSLATTGMLLTPILALPLLTPLEVMKRRAQFNQVKPRIISKELVAKHGKSGLYLGVKPFMTMNTALISALALPHLLPCKRETSDMIGGLLFLTTYMCTHPLDVLTTRAMLGQNKGNMIQDAKVLGSKVFTLGVIPRITFLLVGAISYSMIEASGKTMMQANKYRKAQPKEDFVNPATYTGTISDDKADDDVLRELIGERKLKKDMPQPPKS